MEGEIMEKINRKRSPKGTVTIRKKGNSYEARVTLELASVMQGVDRNPRLSRTALTEKDARKRLGELIVDVYFNAQKKSMNFEKNVFSDECTIQLDKFQEYRDAKIGRNIKEMAQEYTKFINVGLNWLNWKKNQVNPCNNKKISGKTFETYVSTFSHIKKDFKNYDTKDITKELVESYINEMRVKSARLGKELFLMIRQILRYARDEMKIINEVPEFNLKFPKKKRATKTKINYLSEERQQVWIKTCEEDGRGFALLFATLIQTGMRPEERMWSKMEKCIF